MEKGIKKIDRRDTKYPSCLFILKNGSGENPKIVIH